MLSPDEQSAICMKPRAALAVLLKPDLVVPSDNQNGKCHVPDYKDVPFWFIPSRNPKGFLW